MVGLKLEDAIRRVTERVPSLVELDARAFVCNVDSLHHLISIHISNIINGRTMAQFRDYCNYVPPTEREIELLQIFIEQEKEIIRLRSNETENDNATILEPITTTVMPTRRM